MKMSALARTDASQLRVLYGFDPSYVQAELYLHASKRPPTEFRV